MYARRWHSSSQMQLLDHHCYPDTEPASATLQSGHPTVFIGTLLWKIVLLLNKDPVF